MNSSIENTKPVESQQTSTDESDDADTQANCLAAKQDIQEAVEALRKLEKEADLKNNPHKAA